MPFRIWQKATGALFAALAVCILVSPLQAEPDGKALPSREGEAIVSEKDKIKLVEDASVQDAIERRPDLSFENIKIDGEESNASLDSVSSDAVVSVEVMKAVTPDLDADSRGGSINLRTKPAYLQEKVKGQGSIELLHLPMYNSNGYNADFSLSGRMNGNKKLGGRLAIRALNSSNGNENNFQDWRSVEFGGENVFALKNTGLDVYKQDSKRQDLNISIDYKASESWRFFGRASLIDKENYTIIPSLQYRFDRGNVTQLDEDSASFSSAEVVRRNRAWHGFSDTIETTIGGVYQGDNLELDIKYTYQDEDYIEPEFVDVDFVQKNVDLAYVLEERLFPKTVAIDGRNLSEASAYELEDFLYGIWEENTGLTISSIDLKRSGLLGNDASFLKLGVKSKTREKEKIEDLRIFDGFEGSYDLSDVEMDFRMRDHSQGRYTLDALPDYDRARAFFKTNKDSFIENVKRSRESSDPNTFFVNEEVDSYYAMLNWESGAWRSIIGWRAERTNTHFKANEIILGEDESGEAVYLGTNSRDGSTNYSNDFPNAHVRYRWSDRIVLIGSYTNTIKRPDYDHIVPYRNVDLIARTVSEGNPDLKPMLFENLDVSVDIKLANEGLLSLELFQRSIDDFIFVRDSIVVGGIYDGFELRRNENGPEAEISGIQLSLNQDVNLPGIGKGLSLNFKYTDQESEVEYPTRPGVILPLTRNADQTLKVTLTYDRERIFAQAKYSWTDALILIIAEDPAGDRFSAPRSELNLSASYKLRPKLRLYADWVNVNNSPDFKRYKGDPSRPVSLRYRPWTLKTGLKFEL